MRVNWELLPPLIVFAIGVALFSRDENEARVQYLRAQSEWREGRYLEAVQIYQRISNEYPETSFAPQALWESATLLYVNAQQLDEAVSRLEQLIQDYPKTELRDRARKLLAEICETEYQDFQRAIRHWRELSRETSIPMARREALFQVGRLQFEMARFEDATLTLEQLDNPGGPEDYLSQQANLRLGTIYQLQKEYARSIPYFEAVLQLRECSDCRLQAQLGMIESYEFLNDLDSAIRIAGELDPNEYSAELRDDLLERLQRKRRFYEPMPWNN